VKERMLRNKNAISEKLLSLQIEQLEKLSVFSRNKTERVLAIRLLKLYHKKLRLFKIVSSIGDTYTFPEEREIETIEAYSYNHAVELVLKTIVKPQIRRFMDQIDYINTEALTLAYTYGTEDFETTEALIIEEKQ